MLRRKLLLMLGPLVVLLVITAVLAIVLLQDVLRGMDHISQQATVVVDQANQLSQTISLIEMHLHELQAGKRRHLDGLIDAYESMQTLTEQIGQRYVLLEAQATDVYQSLRRRVPVFGRHVSALATAQDPELASWHNRAALEDVVALRNDILTLGRFAALHAKEEQQSLAARFKWLVLGLSLIFLLVINVSVVVLLRAGAMVLRPIDKLVRATEELAAERFDYRVDVAQKDEFDQLARAYNHLAEQLQANEQRRLETLGQTALTLNHELNNAIAIIELQLGLLSRQSGDPALEKYLRQIRQGLDRMTRTVESLKHVRRIVLTDYVAGTKMLDLQRSLQTSPPPAVNPSS